MKKIKRIICAALALVIVGNTIWATNASAHYGNELFPYTNIDPNFQKDPNFTPEIGYVDTGGLTVDGVLSRMKKIGLVQGITYYSAVVMNEIDSGYYSYQDFVDLRGDGSSADGGGDSGLFVSGHDEDWIMSGMAIEKALTGSAEDGRFRRENTKGYLITNLAKALDVRQFERFKDKYNDGLDDKYVYRLLCGEDVYNPNTGEMIHEDGLVVPESGASCSESSQRLKFIGDEDMRGILIARFNYIAHNYGWSEIDMKMTIDSTIDGDRSAMGYFGEVAGYGLYLAETGIDSGAVTNEGCIAGTNESEGTAKEVYLFDSQANNGKITKVTRYIYDGAPGNKKAADYTSFVRKIEVGGNSYPGHVPKHDGFMGWVYETFSSSTREVKGTITCSVMIDRMNEIAETTKVGSNKVGNGLLDHTYKFLLNDTCRTSFEDQKKAAAEVLANPDITEEEQELNENIMEEWFDLSKEKNASGNYVEDDSTYEWIDTGKDEDNHESFDSHGWSEYGYQCIETEYLQSPNQVNRGLDLAASTSSTDESCYSAGGALTWIICPLITTMASATQTIYENFIEPYLVIDSSYFLVQARGSTARQDISSSSNIVRRIWSYFRTVSNLFLVIVLVVIIGSQVTGFGIDNYGIKKMLPKVIVTAIMVNLSFYICLIAIDVANVMGVIMKNLMESIGNMVQINIQLDLTTGEKIEHLALAAVLVTIIGFITYNTIVSYGIGLLIPIVAGLISAVIGVFVLFAVLALRIMIIWMGVAFSGVAIASYMLPNTKKLYDLWFGLMWKALLCYPICSIVVYGGQLMGKIALSVTFANADSLLGQVGAMLISLFLTVGPLIMLPTIIKSSFGMARGIVAAMDHTKMRMQAGSRHHIERSPISMAARRRGIENGILHRNHMRYNRETGQVEDSRRRVRNAQNVLADASATAADKAAAQRYLDSVARSDARHDGFFGSTRDQAANIIAGRYGAGAAPAGQGVVDANERMNAASVKSKRARYAGAEYGFGNVGRLQSELERRLDSGDLSMDNATDMTAIASELASTKEGKKALAGVLATRAKDNSFDTAAIDNIVSVASKADPSIMQALNEEEMPIAQYLQDRMQGKRSASGTYDTWLNSAADDSQLGVPGAVTNFQKVMGVIAKSPAEIPKQGDEVLKVLDGEGVASDGSDAARAESSRAGLLGESDGHGNWTTVDENGNRVATTSDQDKVRASLTTAIANKSGWDGKEGKRTKILRRWARDASAKECSDMLRRRGTDFSAEQRQILLDKIKSEAAATQSENIRRDAASAARSILNDPYNGLDDQELESMRDVVASASDATNSEREYKSGAGRYSDAQRSTMADNLVAGATDASVADSAEARRLLGDRSIKFDAAQRQKLLDHVIAKEGGTVAGAQSIVADFGSELSDAQRQTLGTSVVGSVTSAAEASSVVSSGEFSLTEAQLDTLIGMFATDANLAKATLTSAGAGKLNQTQRDRLLQGVVSQISTVDEASAILTNNNLGIDGAFKQTIANVALGGTSNAAEVSAQAKLLANADLSGVNPSTITAAIDNVANNGTASDISTVLRSGRPLGSTQQQVLASKLFAGTSDQDVAIQADFIRNGGMAHLDESIVTAQMGNFAQHTANNPRLAWDVLMKTDFSSSVALQAQQAELAKNVAMSYEGNSEALAAIGQAFVDSNGGKTLGRISGGGSYGSAQEMMEELVREAKNNDPKAIEALKRVSSTYAQKMRAQQR